MPDALTLMQARYATCASYEDRGTSVTISTYEDGQPPSSKTLTFSTLFDRATGAFRFEYEEPSRWGPTKRAVIWQTNHGPAHLWWTVTGLERVDTLEGHITSLVRSFVHRKGERETTLFVSEDGTLRRYVERDLISTEGIGMPNLPNMTDEERREIEESLRTPRRFRIERTVRYEPVFDQPISSARFDLVPPIDPPT